MLAARWGERGVGLVDVEPGPVPEGRVRLRVAACGICGTDLHLYRRELPAPAGMTPGHEIVGTALDAAGRDALGERLYAIEPRTWCGACDLCNGGRRHLCPRGGIIGISMQGGLAEWVDVPAYALHPVPAGVSAGVASMAEPLAVCVRAVHLARLEASSRVLVLGGGSIGLLAGMLSRDRALEVAIAVRHPHQREAARALGLAPLDEAQVADWARDRGPDVVIETVGGHADTLRQAIQACRPGGRVVVLGVFAGPRPIDALSLMAKELEIVGSNTYGMDRRGSEFGAAVELLPRHRAEIERLQTHRYALRDVESAFAAAADKKSGAIKVRVQQD